MAKRIITEHEGLNLFITLGQGINYGVANECMNKMKEMGLSNSEAYFSLEYRHGPMSLVDENTLIILLSHSETVKEDGKLLAQMKEYGAVTAAIGNTASVDLSLIHIFTAMDDNVGRILKKLEEENLMEDTLIIFSSDNGFNCGHHGIWGKGNGTFPLNMYDSSVKVPLIMCHKGHIPENHVCDEMHSGYDFMPTLLDYLGFKNDEADKLSLIHIYRCRCLALR